MATEHDDDDDVAAADDDDDFSFIRSCSDGANNKRHRVQR